MGLQGALDAEWLHVLSGAAVESPRCSQMSETRGGGPYWMRVAHTGT